MEAVARTATTRTRNPDWSHDETVLLLDLYFRAPRASPSHLEVVALSEHLKALGSADEKERQANFRNPAGVAMKLRNLAQQDPEFLTRGQTGLRKGGRIDAEIWQRYAHDRMLLAREVERIRGDLAISAYSVTIGGQVSRGPSPAFGVFAGERLDGETIVYVLRLSGAINAIFPSRKIAPDWVVAKIGRSNDTARRIAELSVGIPPGAQLQWEVLREFSYATARSAHDAEQMLLRRVQQLQWAIGGEFVIAPLAALLEEAEAITKVK